MLMQGYEVIQTEVFARVPDEWRVHHRKSDFHQMSAHVHIAPLEGPSFDRDGNLYCVDMVWGRIYRIDPQGNFTLIIEYDGSPNGLKIHRDGRIFVADYKNGILLLDPVKGTVSPFLSKYRLEGFKGVNDLFFASNGDMYFTDQGQTGLHDPTGRVYRLTVEGRLELVLTGIPSPNGLVLNLDESRLYVAVTRTNAVWRAPLVPEGGVTKVGVFLQLSGGHAGPDGMALDEQGGLAVAHAGLGVVWLFDELGEVRYRVQSCTGIMTTNVAYAPDRNELYITEAQTGTILRAKVPVAGKRMFSHM